MAGYVTVNRLSLVQLHCEERKHRAHLKKIAEMQRRSGLDNSTPAHFPHVHDRTSQLKEKQREISRENDATLKKILDVMKSKTAYSTTNNPAHLNRRSQTLHLSQSNTDYLQRVAKTKGFYDVREWKRGFEEHKEHLKISKDNSLYTPRDIGINRQRIKAASLPNSKRTTPSSSVINMEHQLDKNN